MKFNKNTVMTDLEYAVKHSRFSGYGKGKFPDIIPLDFGMDFKLATKPQLYPKIASYSDTGKRTVTLKLDTYLGYCPGAVHWYGKLEADGIHIIEDVADSDGKIHKQICGGHICEEYSNMENSAFYNSRYEFEVIRELTQKEIDENPTRWESYWEGVMVNAFYTSDEIIEIAKKIVAERFPDWEFKIVFS